MSTQIDFASIAQAALAAAERLVPQWLPHGRREGHEWSSLNPNRSDSRHGSFKVNLTTGMWADFATGEKGGDLISLFAFVFTDGDQGKAARELASDLSMTVVANPKVVSIKEQAKARSAWEPVTPVPARAGPPHKAHPRRGVSATFWTYHDADGAVLGYVHRFVTSEGGKEILPSVWARNRDTGREEWRWMQWTEPRPLYGLDRLAAMPDKPVLVVEGEKCADAAYRVLGSDFAIISWPGGGKAVAKVDWTPLKGRRVVIWPDCDAQKDRQGLHVLPEAEQPGVVAAERIAVLLAELDCAVDIVAIPAPGEKPNGWDVADAVAERMKREQLLEFVANVRPPAGPGGASVVNMAEVKRRPDATPAAPADRDWAQGLLRRRGEFVSCLANLVRILLHEKSWQGVIAFNSFSMRAVKLKGVPGVDAGEAGDWSSLDTGHTIIWFTNVYGITPTTDVVEQAVDLVAHVHEFHPVCQYLRGLTWDGVPRLETWLEDCLGVNRTEYTSRVGKWFLIGMVARVERPGCKFDACLVLEGDQGRRKSTFFRILGGEWFSDTELDLTSKDAMSALRGKWLHEFPEMGSIARAEANRQKSFLTRQIDEFRPVYDRREVRCPRQLVFAGTTNEWQWQKDPTGGRRFWPIEVRGDIETAWLEENRDQLFAEAFVAFQAGERYWPTSDEQKAIFDPVQLSRETEDAFFELVHDWIEVRIAKEFTLAEVLGEALKLDAGRMTRDVMTRVGMILKKMGCTRRERRNGVVRFVYELPSWTKSAQARAAVESSDGPMPI